MMLQQQMMQQQAPPNMTRMHADQIDQMGPLSRNHNDMLEQNQSPKFKNNNNYRHQQQYQQQHMNKNIKNGDVLAGMMTDKEKNWVINVQMLQLQNDDPYSYDFYYTVNL
jgi:DNA topoisomerase 2-associated protein PAT1